MNKVKIGKYLRNLRLSKIREKDGKAFSQDNLVEECEKRNITISINAIAEWEKGTSIPTIDNIKVLAEIYNKTIDEILEGEDDKDIDFKAKYFLYDSKWLTSFPADNLYKTRNEQILLITKRFKELLFIRIERYLSRNEEKELYFLFKHYYTLREYAYNYSNNKSENHYVIFYDALNNVLIEHKKKSKEEKYWEIQKLYSEKDILHFKFRVDGHDLRKVSILQERFDKFEHWQKDMYLAMFQNLLPYDADADKHGGAYLKRYEEENNEEFNRDKEIKNDIKEMIKRGACINKYFFNMKKVSYEEKRIIDRLEELYNLCLKPIEIKINDEGKEKTYKIENNQKNRFLKDYYFMLKNLIHDYTDKDNFYNDINELYNWFINTDSISDEFLLSLAKRYNIDTKREKKYVLADLRQHSQLGTFFDKFKNKELEIENGLVELEKLKSKLVQGEKHYRVKHCEIVGSKGEESIREDIEYWKEELDYKEYLKNRDHELTNKLLKDLDSLSFDEIKDKYFKEEIIKDE